MEIGLFPRLARIAFIKRLKKDIFQPSSFIGILARWKVAADILGVLA